VEEQYARFIQHLAAHSSIDAQRFIDDVQRQAACYKGIKELGKQSSLWAELLTHGCSKETFETLLGQEKWIFDSFEENNRKIRATLPESLHYPELIARLKQGALACLKEASCPDQTLLRLAQECKAEVERHAIFSPDQIVERLAAALEEFPFLEAVQKKYRAAIIDEFQDTDPTQWAVFKRLFVGHVETLCLVGDPKQSIYAFRRADIYTYLNAKETLGQHACRRLNTNYRSSPRLVEALNQLFALSQEWLSLPKNQSFLTVQPVKAGVKQNEGRSGQRGAVHFFIASGEKGRSQQWPTVRIEEEQLFPFIAQEAQEVHAKSAVPWESIAVLVKDRFQAERLITHLKRHGIPASFRKGTVADRALYALKRVLEAVLHPSDASVLKIALFGPLFALNESDALESAKVQILILHKLLYNEGFGPFYHQLLTLLRQVDLDLYRELRTLGMRLLEEEMHAGLRGEDFLTFLKDIDPEELEVPPQEAAGSLSVMTVHLSKGLEFDTVFALGLASRHAKQERLMKKEHTYFVYDQNTTESQEALDEIDAEKMRLLYVALTRAKAQLYIPLVLYRNNLKNRFLATSALPHNFNSHSRLASGQWSLAPNQNSEEPPCQNSDSSDYFGIDEKGSSPIELFFSKMGPDVLPRLAATCSLTYEQVQVKESLPAEQKTVIFPTPPPPVDFLPQPEYITSFTALAVKKELTPVSNETLPVGAKTGIVLHAIFEAIFAKSLHHPLDEQEIGALIERMLFKTALAAHKETIHALVIHPLRLSLLPGLTLQDLPPGSYGQELEFLYPLEKGMMKGVVDLWFLFDGKYYVLDWKSNALEGYAQEQLQQAMHANDYYLQASIYATALKRYVKLFDNRPFEACFGGAFYLFVRGNGVFHFIPEVT
jgi:exodeoxyribonuclease V beta subunit